MGRTSGDDEDWASVMRRAKTRHRPRLKDWSRDGFATTRSSEFESLAAGRCEGEGAERVCRLDYGVLCAAAFARDYELTSTPVIVRDVPAREGWSAAGWSYDGFFGDSAFRGLRMKCGEDDDGRTIRVTLKDFATYAAQDCMGDDSPLYVFDGGFGDRAGREAVVGAFRAPTFCGRDDLFELVGGRRRPPHRWLLVGPRRSGTCAHVDPLGTSAWNTLLTGRKRWVLFEPGTSRHVAKGSRLYDPRVEDDEAINYFVDILPRIRAAYPEARRVECIQEPGETIFVPGGWWHAVINLEDTIGVTQNFASRGNFDDVWDRARVGRRSMARTWLAALEAHGDPEIRRLAGRAAMHRPPFPSKSRKRKLH